MKRKVELLAPVGDMESIYAAIENGADAVYLGGELFSARKHASNFNYEELKKAIKYAHLHRKEVHVAVNILLEDEEVKEALDYINYLYSINVDAIILQDIGLAMLVKEMYPDLPIHASTQMTINNLEGALFAEEIGFSRVVLAREVPYDEIKRIKENTNLEIEVFIHGALCISYSGQCLMSSLIGGRSGNRGDCAQPCRKPYSIVDENGKNLSSSWENRYILSTKDLNTIDNIDKLMDIGVDSLKIEGRMKRPEYVATIVSKYRKAIDKGIEKIDENDRKDIEQIFNREFTKGLTFGDFGSNYISDERPDNRGIFLGNIIKMDKKYVYINLKENLESGDGLEFKLRNGNYRGMICGENYKKGNIAKLKRIGNIEDNSEVYKTSSKSLLDKAESSYKNNTNKYPIRIKFTAEKDKAINMKILFEEKEIKIESKFIVEESKKNPINTNIVEEQLNRLGNTIFYLEKTDIRLDEKIFIPVSVINELRRDGIEKLEKEILDRKRNILSESEFLNKKSMALNIDKQKELKDNLVSIRVNNMDQFRKLDLSMVDRIYIGFQIGLEEVIEKTKDFNLELYIWTDKILYKDDIKKLETIISKVKNQIDGVSVSNYGTLYFIKKRFKELKIHGDIGLNVFNSYSVSFLRTLGVDSITLSSELNLSQIENINNKVGGLLEIQSYGYQPSMVIENCPMALIKKCENDKNCKHCKYTGGYGLKDYKDMIFKLERLNGFTTLYNSVPLMVLDNLDKILMRQNLMIRLDFTMEKELINELQQIYFNKVNGLIDNLEIEIFMDKFKKNNKITNGHFFRGII